MYWNPGVKPVKFEIKLLNLLHIMYWNYSTSTCIGLSVSVEPITYNVLKQQTTNWNGKGEKIEPITYNVLKLTIAIVMLSVILYWTYYI